MAAAAAVAVQQVVVSGSLVGGGRSFAQVEHYSAEASDLLTRGVGAGIEEYVFLGWLTPLLALAGLWAIRRRGGLAWLLGLAAVIPGLLALGSNLPLYEPLWRALPPLRFARVPERLLPIACLAIAALVALAVEAVARNLELRLPAALVTAIALVVLAVDVHVHVFGAVEPDRANRAYAAIDGEGRLFELPVFNPGIHYGSVYLAYSRQSPRQRPQGYSTTARRAADILARRLRPLSCGRGFLPDTLGVRFVAVHRGLYRQSGWFAPDCADRAEAKLRRDGWRLLARDGAISTWQRP